MNRGLLVGLLLTTLAPPLSAYDRTAARNYAASWYETDLNGNVKVDHVNSPTYTWYYLWKIQLFGREIYSSVRTNSGDDSVLKSDGVDCSNFVSQTLKAGGISISGPGVGGTIPGAAALGVALRQISVQTALPTSISELPSSRLPGDVMEFTGVPHMVVIISTSPELTYAAHTRDRFDHPISAVPPYYFPAVFHHIIGETITPPNDSVPPTIDVTDPINGTLSDGGFSNGSGISVTAADSGGGVKGFEITKGQPIVDGAFTVDDGLAQYISRDSSSYGANHVFSIPALSAGVYFFQVFDSVGNYRIFSVGVDTTRPVLSVSANGTTIEPGGASSGKGISISADDRGGGGGGAAPVVSGLAKIEIWKGALSTAAGGTLLASNSDPYGTDHIYTKDDPGLAILDQLPEAQIFVRVADKAGNDTSVRFEIRTPAPNVTFTDPYLPLFNQLQGVAVVTPTSISPTQIITIHDDAGVASVTLPNSPATVEVLTPLNAPISPVPAGTKDLTIKISNLPVGIHAFSVTNKNGKVTSGTWKVETLAFRVNSSVASYDAVSDAFMGTIELAADSTAGTDKIVQFNPISQEVIGADRVSPFSISASNADDFRYFYMRDKSGNGVSQNLYTYQSAISSTTALQTDGSQSASITLSFATPGNWPFSGQSAHVKPGMIRNVGNTMVLPGVEQSGELAGPVNIVNEQQYGTYSLMAGGELLISGSFSSLGDTRVNHVTSKSVPDDITFTLTMTKAPFVGVSRDNCLDAVWDNTTCSRPKKMVASVFAHPAVRALAYTLSLPDAPPHIRVFAGPGQNISLGGGVSLTGFTATGPGFIVKPSLIKRGLEPGYKNLLGDQVFEIAASDPVFYNPAFTLTLPFDGTKHTTGAKVYLARLAICNLTLVEATLSAGNKATAQVNGFGKYAVVEKAFATPRELSSGACHFMSDKAGLAVTESNPDARYKQAVNVIGSLGYAAVGTTCDMSPSGTAFSPPGAVKLCFAPADLEKAGVSNNPLTLFQFSKTGVREELANMFIDRERGIIAGNVDRFSSEFGVFASSPATAAIDLLPPVSTLSVGGQAVSTGALVVVNTTSTLALSAVDPLFPGAPTSGVAGTFILIDKTFVDFASTPGLPYSGPFSLSIGTHTLAFYSTDATGNRESVNIVNVLANPPPDRGVAGLAVGHDSSSRLWTVVLDSGAVTLGRTDGFGVMVASAPMPLALSDGRWSLLFDGTGGVYAVGAAEGPSTQASDVAVYKASPDGDALVSTGYFDGGLGGADFVFDAAAPGWIAGAVEISGGALKAALWRLDPSNGDVTLSTAFASGAAMGVAVDTDGSVWTAGYVRNPSPRSSRVYNLGLWHFASDGQTLLAGPYTREAYVADFSPTFATDIAISSSAVTVVAPRGRPGGGTDLGSVRFDKTSGAVLADNAWRAGDGSAAYPAVLLSDGEGTLAAGGLDVGVTQAALWRFGADGGLVSASLAGAGGARGAATAGADLWLAVDDATAPYKVTSPSALAGTLADVRPPRVEIAVGTPTFVNGGGDLFATETTFLGFASTDDRLAVGDGLGAGAPAVYYRADSTGSFAAFASSFNFAAEGTHVVEFYGVDAADNPGPILSRTITIDRTAPVTQVSQNGAEITLEASDPNGAGVSRIRYLVDYGDPAVCNNVAEDTAAARGTCENPWYAGPFVLSNGSHTLYYQAFDAVGNAEVLQSTYPFVEAPGSGPSAGGMGIGKDALDAFWTVVAENNALAFAHSNSSGALISSSTLQDAVEGFPWSVLFGPDGRAYAVGGAAGPATQALDLAVYKASPVGDAIESRTLFDSGYANNDIAFDAKAPGWIVGAAQTSGPTDLAAPGPAEFSMALWRFDPALGTIQLKTTYARAGFDLGAGLAVDADGSLWIAGYSLSSAAPAVGGFDLALWHYAADGQTLLGGPFLRSGYLDNIDGGLTARVYVSSQAVYVAAPRANNLGGTDMAFLRYDKVSGLPTSEIAWRPADGAPSYPIAVLSEASGLLVAGGIGGNLTEAGLWRFGFDGALQGVTTTDAGGATGAVFRGTELWLSVDGSTVPYRVDAEVAAAGSLVDLAPPRTSLSAGAPSFVEAQTVYVTSAAPLGFAVADDYAALGDGLGVGATQTFYAESGGAYSRFTSSFTLVAEGTHTIRFYSVDLAGNLEAVNISSIAVDITAPISLLQFVGPGNTDAQGMLVISANTLLEFSATDPISSGVAAGVKKILVGVDGGLLTAYETPFSLTPGLHTISYFALDNLDNAETPRTVQLSVGPLPLTSVDFVAKSAIGADAQNVAVDSASNVYVNVRTRILKLGPDGLLLASWGTAGSGPGQLSAPDGMRIGPDGNLYVADSQNLVVHIFDPSGAFLADIRGGFSAPVDVAFDSAGQLNVLDIRAGQIFRTKLDGTPIATIPVVPGSFGGLAIDPQDNMYVANFTARRVHKYTAAGQQLLSFGGEAGLAALNRPRHLDIDPAGRVHVVDWFGNRIAVYSSTGAYIGEYGTSNANPGGALNTPLGIAILKSGARAWVSPSGTGVQAVFQYALQTSLPSAPALVSPVNGARVYGLGALVLGRSKAGMKVALFDAGLLAATTTVLDSSGAFAVQIPLSAGAHRITAQASTNMGFSSTLSSSVDFTLAAGPPAFSFGSPVAERIPNPPFDGIASLTTVTADFNGDGNPDLFAIGWNGYSVFLGDGKGGFNKLPPVAFPTVGNFGRTTRAYAADLNKDGKMDVVILDAAPLLRVMQGNGNGTFGDGTYQSVVYIAQGFPSGYAPWDFFLGDLDSDGNLDIITTDGRNLGVLLGRGDPGFTFASQPLVPTGLTPLDGVHMLQAADFNRDGKLDVVMAGAVFLGDGAGGFSSSTVLCSQCRYPLVGDANQDGNPDIALFSNSVNVFVGFGDGTFKALPPQPFPSGAKGTLGVTGPVPDLNGDGLPDLAYGGFTGGITLFPGRGDGLFGAPQTISLANSCSSIYIETISSEDFDKNGAIDLVSALNHEPCSSDEVAFLFNQAVPIDNTPPSAVTNLASQSNPDGTVSLIWTAPGDNGGIGQAAAYDIRAATVPITTLALFNSAVSLSGVSAPLAAGFSEDLVVTGLSGGTTFFFALRTTDRAGNTSALSNSPSVKTLFVNRSAVAINGQPEFSFVNASLQPVMTVIGSTSAVGTLVLGSATAQGLVLVSRIYELQPEGAVFSPPASLTMRYSTATLAELGVLEQDLVLHRFDAAQGWLKIPGQTQDTQNRLITVPISEIMSIYALGGIVRDRTPPQTMLTMATGSRFVDSLGVLYGSSSTTFGFEAFDPVVFGTASGVAFTQFRIDAATPTAPFTLFTAFYMLTEGMHLVEFRSQDSAGNLEIARSSQVIIDGTAPLTSLVLDGPRAPGTSSTTFVVSSVTSLGFQSIDPIVNGAASGAAKINFRVDGGTFFVFNATFTLTPGSHSIDFAAVDAVGNVEAVQRALVVVDTQTPNVILTSPSGGERFVAGVSTIAVQFVVTDPLDPAPTFYAAFVEQEDRGSPRGDRPAVVPVSSGQVLLPFDLDDGLWLLRIQAANSILNSTVVTSVPFEVVHDTMQPRTTLAISTPQAPGGPGGALFVTGQTPLTLSSIDDLVASNDALGLGTAFQEVSIDGLLRMRFQNQNPAQGQVFSSSFTLNADSDGVHVVAFAARDVLQNQEVISRTTVAVDNTPPITQLVMSTPSFGSFVAPRTVLTLSAADPIINGVASGVTVTRYQDNDGTFSASTAPLRLAEGAHMLAFQSADALGNLEVLRSTSILVDATPPVTVLSISTLVSGGYVASAARFVLSAEDPIVNGAASGIESVLYRVNGGAFVSGPLNFGLSGADGVYILDYQSRDNVGNLEVLHSTTVLLDQTAPVSAAHVGSPSFTALDGTLYVDPGTPVTLTALDSGSGVERIEVSVDGAAFAPYAAALTFPEGRHAVAYRAVDEVGNVETARTLSLRSDATAPLTTFAPSGTLFVGADGFFAPSGFTYGFSATDPVSGDVASGVAFTRFRTESVAPGLFDFFASTFSLAEGVRRVEFHSQDRVGNLELLRSATVFVDATAPETALTIGAPRFPAGTDLYVGTGTLFSLASRDPVAQAVASGVSSVTFRVGAGAFASYAAPFLLQAPDGAAAVAWRASDNVGNLESAKTSVVLVDGTAPFTSLVVSGGRQFPVPGGFYASADTRLSFGAVDPVVGGAASGVAFTRWQDGGGAFQTYAAPLALPEGAHALGYQSEDNVANREVLRSTAVLVDATAPVSAVSIGSPGVTAVDGTVHVTPAVPLSFSAADPALPTGQPGSGVERVEVSVDGGAFSAAAGPLTFDEGSHDVRYRALDRVGNVEAERALALQSDATPPVTTLAVSSPSSGGYVSAATRLTLTAEDPIVAGAVSGVAFTSYRVDGAAFVTAPLTFGLSGADGAYTVDYRSQDKVGNLETLHAASFTLDQTAPVTAVAVGAPSFTAPDGTLFVDPATPVTLTALDSGSGVERIEVGLDGAPFAPYAAALTFTEGRHTLLYRAVDKVGNVETARTLSLRSDATAPLTTFTPSGTLFAGAGGLFAPAHFSYALPAVDPMVQDVASGLAFTRYALDAGAYQINAGTFTLTEGARRVDFQSRDNLGHEEPLKSATVFVDATAPVTALGVGSPRFASSGTLFVSTATPLTLASQDPEVAGVASGVSMVSYRLDSAAFGPYLSAFRISASDGPHELSWSAADNVGNVEAAKTGSVTLDATAPRSALLVIGGRQISGPNAASFYASSDTRVSFMGEDPMTEGSASGLARIRFQDNDGAFQNFAAPLVLDEGRHALGYQGQDNVLNLEVLRSTTVLVDATPPVTTVSIGAPAFTAYDGTVYIVPASSISFSAADPSLPSGEPGSGVEHVEASVDGGVFAAIDAPLTFSEGLHTVRYRALDRVGNVEAERTLQLRSDATPPASELAIGDPSFQLSSATVLVSSATPLSVAALDPTVNGVASGVKETFYRFVDVSPSTAPFLVFTASFTFTGADRAASVEFYSQDRVLNTEPARSRALLLDSTRPDAAIDSPRGGDGICSVVKGMIPVRGTARDLHFASYILESAPGRDAAAGFVLVSSGAAAVDAGLLGTWDARGLSGWQTLRLTVVDQVRNKSVTTLSVFVGDPGRLLVLGNHETFNMPQGVAADAGGRIYVADTNDDRVQVFSATGTALVSFGHGHGREADEGLRLNKPKGVAVDAAGAIYVADTQNDRVLKLSATGQILLEVGRRKPGGKDDDGKDKGKNESQEFLSGKGPGEFRKPSGIAVDGHGNIFVADTDNNRVQKLGPDGTPLLAFNLPIASGDGTDDDNDSESPELGRPVGVALDGAGNIYVADPRGARALKFSAAGQLLMTLPVHREGSSGKPGRPVGIAVSPEGNCILVSDQGSSRVIKFDAAGAQTLEFGERGKIKDNRPLPKRLVLRKPSGLALGADGKLYVADRNNDRIQVFGLPTGEPASAVPPSAHDHDDEYAARDVVDREDGGLVERDDRAGVSIPAGALSEDLRITVSTPAVADEDDRDRNRDEQNLKVVSAPIEYGPEGTKFKEPVTLTLPYTPDLIAAQGVAEDSLKVNYWNKEKGEWEALESEVDKKNGTVKAKTPHFSLYQVLGSTGVSSAVAPLAADASFGFKDMYAFPNPVRGQGPVTIRIQPGLADSITVRVYDVSGRKVHDSSNFVNRGAFDDGNGKGQQFTYDHVWDVSGVGSGVYTFVVTATKSGERDIHKTGKVGIIK